MSQKGSFIWTQQVKAATLSEEIQTMITIDSLLSLPPRSSG
jgi:hypothetical protein